MLALHGVVGAADRRAVLAIGRRRLVGDLPMTELAALVLHEDPLFAGSRRVAVARRGSRRMLVGGPVLMGRRMVVGHDLVMGRERVRMRVGAADDLVVVANEDVLGLLEGERLVDM